MAKRKPVRPRIHPYLSAELLARFEQYVAVRGATESAVVTEALEQFLAGMGDCAVLYRRLDNVNKTVESEAARLSGEIQELRQQVVIQGQLLRLLLATWLNGQAPKPGTEKRQRPADSYREIMEALGHRMVAGRTLIDELPQEARAALAALTGTARDEAGPRS